MSNFEHIKKCRPVSKCLLLGVVILNLTACGGESLSDEPLSVSYDGIWQGVYTTEWDPTEKPLYMIAKDDNATIIYDGYNLATSGLLTGDSAGFSVDPNTNFTQGLSAAIYLRQETIDAEVSDGGLTLSYDGELSVDDIAFGSVMYLYTGFNAYDPFELGFIVNVDLEKTPQSYKGNIWETDLMTLPISLEDIVGTWSGSSISIDTLLQGPTILTLKMVIDANGDILASDSDDCTYEGTVIVPDESVNSAEFSLEAQICPIIEGGPLLETFRLRYTGPGFLNAEKNRFTIGLENGSSVIAMTLSPQ